MPKTTRSESRLDSKYKQLVIAFFRKQKALKQAQSEFTKQKEEFYNLMEDYFGENGINDKFYIDDAPDCEPLVVRRVQSSKVDFDLAKLEKALGRQLSKEVVTKHYEITDVEGLIAYLKECGVDPKIFKSFLSVTKELDMKKLDMLADLGKITEDQIEGCYTIKKNKPYFTVSVGRGQNDEEGA